MSTAWKGPVVLLKEPPSAFWARLAYRLVLAAALGLAAFLMPLVWLAVPLWVLASLVALLAVLAVVNIVRNRGVLLVFQGSGAIEWPRSVQELILKRPLAWVAGAQIVVTHPPVAAMPGRLDPRIDLTDGEHTIANVPLYGVDPAAFVDAANGLLVGRGTVLRYEERPPQPEDGDAAS